MTIQEAESLGYSVVQASMFEVGLLKNGKGIRTWWAPDFGGVMPKLDHPIIQGAIAIQEKNFGVTRQSA